jgi:phosphoglycolate phosphatase-like HAD superfamily hydrolase
MLFHVFDFDGTLFWVREQKLYPEAKRVLEKFGKEGKYFAIATRRPDDNKESVEQVINVIGELGIPQHLYAIVCGTRSKNIHLERLQDLIINLGIDNDPKFILFDDDVGNVLDVRSNGHKAVFISTMEGLCENHLLQEVDP